MTKLPRPILVAAASALAVLVVAVAAFGLFRLVNRGEVLGRVVVAGMELGGLREQEARTRLTELERQLRSEAIPVIVGSARFDLQLGSIDYTIDAEAIVERALATGREGNIAGQFAWWLRDLVSGDIEIPLPYAYDGDSLDVILRGWEVEGLADPPFPGEIVVNGGDIAYRYPARGTGIDREGAVALISASIGDPGRPTVELPTRILDPVVTAEDVDRAVARTRSLLDGPITLTNEDVARELVVPGEVLGAALLITIDETAPDPDFVFGLDAEPLLDFVAEFTGFLRTDPVDAEILIDVETDEVTLVPSTPIFEVDLGPFVDTVWEAMNDPTRAGHLPFAEGAEAEFSTADAEALGIRELIGEFTTNHPAGQRRVINIQLMADYLDGAMVMPGETFSVNAHVGRRTEAKGFVCAGALVGFELVEEGPVCIGGGSSQFATTLHNAVFFAGLEHVAFSPHTAWFSRYPEGREATLGYPSPDYRFRNDTDNAVIIRTTYTPNSITVKIYGDNGGRQVEAGLSSRCCHTPVQEVWRINPELKNPQACDEDSAVQTTSGQGGWTVTVYRYITWPDGEQTTEEWRVRYLGLWRIFEYNPDQPSCQPPEDPPEDPENGE